MKISFTICSANFLPYAKVLGDSLIQHNSDHLFIIVLLDKYRDIDFTFFHPHTVLHAEDMLIPAFDEMNERYSIFELSCALKPYAAEYLFRTRPQCDLLFYFDADIVLYSALNQAETALADHPILFTPHIATAKEFENRISIEKNLLRTGVYNAGFFGLKRDKETNAFLMWWMHRMKDQCYNDAAEGLFVDQLWINLAPVLFRDAAIFYDEGYNVAYWNLGERTLMNRGGAYMINEKYPLVFFHYSGFDLNTEVLSKHFPVYTFENTPQVAPLFTAYKESVLKDDRDNFLSLAPQLGKKEPPPPEPEEIIEIPQREKFFKRKYNQLFRKKTS